MNTIPAICTPQLQLLHRGKVRDSFRVDGATRLLIVSDRISAFDRVLETPVPMKGEVLSRLSNWWFEKTADMIPNHVIRVVDPAATLVREVEPIRIEMVVRGYLTGSLGRAYEKACGPSAAPPCPTASSPTPASRSRWSHRPPKKNATEKSAPRKSSPRAGPPPNATNR